jgi:hypothetical protein
MDRNGQCLLLSLCLIGAATSAIAQPASLDVSQYTLRAETLSPKERQEIYLRLIENFVGWAENLGRFIETDELEAGGGYFDAAGRGVSWARGNSNLCVAYAILLTAFPERREFSIHKIPRAVLEDHLRRTIRALCLSNKNCSHHKPAKHKWGGPSWQASLEFIGCAWAAQLCQGQLDEDTLAMVREVLCCEADHLDKEIPSNRFNNTGAEDCGWNAPLLALAANKCADDPRAAKWDSLCKKWAYNAASTDADAGSEEVVDGRPLKAWIVSENVHPDLTLENHGMWSVGYQCCQQHFGEAALAYNIFGRPDPEALGHHADEMWQHVTSALYLWDGDILFPHGQDWSWKTYSSIEYLCWQNCCRRNSAAGATESRALQMIYRRQLALGSGDLGAAVSEALDFGNQTVKPKRWAFCYLMHEHLENAPELIAFPEAETKALGVHIYPFTKVAIHRTRDKCVSVSWHQRHQPIYVLPEGNSTFVDPPFFFPYDRESGCAQVEVVQRDVRVVSKNDNPRHPADLLLDGDLATFWITGVGDSRPGDGPTPRRPDWVQFEYPQPLRTATLVLRPRERYGPRDIELQTPLDGGEQFKTIARFKATNEPRQLLKFPETTSRVFRVVVLSSYDPSYPDETRNAQIRELDFLETGKEAQAKPQLTMPELDEATQILDGKGMRVSYRKPCPGGVTQLVTVVSLPNEATVYATIFHASQALTVKLAPLFPLRASAPPGFEKTIRQHRGDRWLNMSDHVGFVSTDPLPEEIPDDRFFLTEERTYKVHPGQWFGRAVVAIYARQPHEQTEQKASAFRVQSDSRPEKFTVTADTCRGTHELKFDFGRMGE